MKKISSILLFVMVATVTHAQTSRKRTVKKRPILVNVSSRSIDVKEIGYPGISANLKGAVKISEESWRKVELKFYLEAVGAKDIEWIDELEIDWRIIIPIKNKKPTSKNDLFPILVEKKVTYTNVIVDPRKELVVNLFINPVMYERYLRDKMNDRDISFMLSFKADGRELVVNQKRAPILLTSGGKGVPISYWGLPASKFQQISNPKLLILNKLESPFRYASLNGFLNIKKQDK
jgi:hypothetical protein